MRRKASFLIPLISILFCVSPFSHAQLWSGILDPSRAIDWSNAGVTGGIPNRTTICATLNPGATASQINSAISSCPSGQVVKLNAGSYTLSSGLQMKSNVTLRGAGAASTILTFTGSSSYYWGSYLVGFIGNYTGGFENSPPGFGGANPSNLKNWTGTNGENGVYTKGATVLNLNSVSGSPNLQVGDILQLAQTDDSGPTSGPFICSSSGCATEGSGYTHGTGMRQNVKVVAINGTSVTISPGIYMNTWRSSQNPKAYWWGGDIRFAGLEDVRITSSLGVWGAIEIFETSDSWLRGVALHVGNGTRAGIRPILSRNITIQDSFVDSMQGGGFGSTTSYGIEPFAATACLVQNNILNKIESAVLASTGTSGCVFAYNYEVTPSFLTTGLTSHEIGFQMNLWEGNDTSTIRNDDIHGTQNFTTYFRNRIRGDLGTAPLDIMSYARYGNIIGNVLGTSSTQNRYECAYPDTNGACGRFSTPGPVYRFGYCESGTNCPQAGVAGDSSVKDTSMRWGNYDVVNGTRFVSSEVPSGLSSYANPVPSDQNLPASFYLNSKPNWWPASKPWPAIGSDVSGGNISGLNGHAYTLPAQDCYTSIGGNIANFNASTCYQTQNGPEPPTGLNADVH